jgi:hypothetical protein
VVQHSREEIIKYLNSLAGEEWSRWNHMKGSHSYGPASGNIARVFYDDSRTLKSRVRMDFSKPEIRWRDIGDKPMTLKCSDTGPERVLLALWPGLC